MRKAFVLLIVISTLLSFRQFLPWWYFTVPCFFLGFFASKSAWSAFLFGFLLVFILWIYFLLYYDFSSKGTLAEKITLLLHFPNKQLLFLMTGFVGGTLGGTSALIGLIFQIRKESNTSEQ
jgi:hypothetical protein